MCSDPDLDPVGDPAGPAGDPGSEDPGSEDPGSVRAEDPLEQTVHLQQS